MTDTPTPDRAEAAKIDRILAIGVPYMNYEWVQYPTAQERMIEAFQHTQGFKDARAALMAIVREAKRDNETMRHVINYYLGDDYMAEHPDPAEWRAEAVRRNFKQEGHG